jgi:hypothetical protein
MSTEPEEKAEENPEKKIEIERIPEPVFGGTRERLSVVPDDEPADVGAIVGPIQALGRPPIER